MKRTILKLSAVLFLLVSYSANSTPIIISGATNVANDGIWDITYVDGTFDTLSSTLTSQVWWGDLALAQLFATTLGIGAGNTGSSEVGPHFAYETVDRDPDPDLYLQVTCQTFDVTVNNCGPSAQIAVFADSRTRLFTYATAARVPEPSIIALFAAGLVGLGFARRRKVQS